MIYTQARICPREWDKILRVFDTSPSGNLLEQKKMPSSKCCRSSGNCEIKSKKKKDKHVSDPYKRTKKDMKHVVVGNID